MSVIIFSRSSHYGLEKVFQLKDNSIITDHKLVSLKRSWVSPAGRGWFFAKPSPRTFTLGSMKAAPPPIRLSVGRTVDCLPEGEGGRVFTKLSRHFETSVEARGRLNDER
jgi:hypothetical protein